MQINTTRCKSCRGEMSPRTLDPIEGEEHGVKLRLEGMPAMQCEAGHKRFVMPEFAIKMMEALMADPELVALQAANEKGLFRKHYVCPQCGEALPESGAGRVSARRGVEIPGLEKFAVVLDVPKYRCAKCGGESVEPQKVLVNDLMKASVVAFKSVGITPA
jgi:DNA-directed RNA polymerase subunit RPC12/RpoP